MVDENPIPKRREGKLDEEIKINRGHQFTARAAMLEEFA